MAYISTLSDTIITITAIKYQVNMMLNPPSTAKLISFVRACHKKAHCLYDDGLFYGMYSI